MGISSKSLPPHVLARIASGMKPGVAPGAASRVVETANRRRAKGQVNYEKEFFGVWQLLGGPPLSPQHRFDADRRWKLDYAQVESKVAIEIHGGIYTQGRHTQGSGFREDRRKMTAAQEAGFIVYELTPRDITAAEVERIIEKCRERMKGASK